MSLAVIGPRFRTSLAAYSSVISPYEIHEKKAEEDIAYVSFARGGAMEHAFSVF